MMRRNLWKRLRDDVVEMQRDVALHLQALGIEEPPPDVELLIRNLAATRRTLEALWVKS